MVYGESGQPDLYELIRQRLTSFWGKLQYDSVPRLSKHILTLVTHLHEKPIPYSQEMFKFPWLELARSTLNELGLSYIWNTTGLASPEPKSISKQVKIRSNDARKQVWLTEVNSNPHCSLYKLFKNEWGMEKYLQIVKPNLRIPLSKFRVGSHHLPSTINRFKPSNSTQTVCPLCDSNLKGDEFHYILICDHLKKRKGKVPPRQVM